MGWAVLFFVACILAAVGATLGAVFWLAREAVSLLAFWFLNWDRPAPEKAALDSIARSPEQPKSAKVKPWKMS